MALLAPFIVLVAHLGPSDGWTGHGRRRSSACAPDRPGCCCLLLVVWGYDTGAYAAGRWFGRRQLIPHISPSKTIEGVAGGIVTATIAAAIGAC